MKHLFRGHASDGHRQPDIVEARLFLAKHTDMVGVLRRPLVNSRGGKRSINATFQFFAKFFDAPGFDEKGQTRFGAQLARAMVAENENDLAADRRRLRRQ